MKKTHYRHLITAALGAIAGLLFFSYLAYSEGLTISENLLIHFLIFGLIGAATAVGFQFISVVLDKLISWQRSPGLRLIIGVSIFGVLLFIISFAAFWVITNVLGTQGGSLVGSVDLKIKLAILCMITVVVYSVLYFAFYSYNLYTRGRIEKVRQRRKQVELQLAALKSQLSPHFLFNSLNTYSSLIHNDIRLAEEYIRKFAFNYDYSLRVFQHKVTPLSDELMLVENYVYQLKVRFGNNVELVNSLPDSLLSTKVPPLTLQILVENAVKHNKVSESHKLKVEINFRNQRVEVKNRVLNSDEAKGSFGIGLKNINSRYKLLTGKEIKIERNEFFIVSLPVIK